MANTETTQGQGLVLGINAADLAAIYAVYDPNSRAQQRESS